MVFSLLICWSVLFLYCKNPQPYHHRSNPNHHISSSRGLHVILFDPYSSDLNLSYPNISVFLAISHMKYPLFLTRMLLQALGEKKTFFSEHIVTLRQRVAADTPAVLTYLLSCSWGQSEASRIKNQWWLKLNLFMPFISTLKISSHLFIHINITPCSCKISNLLTNYRKHKPYSAILTV